MFYSLLFLPCVALGAVVPPAPKAAAPISGTPNSYSGSAPGSVKQQFGSYQDAGYDASWDGAGDYKSDNDKPVVPLGTGTGRSTYEAIDPDYYTPDEIRKQGDKKDCHPVEKTVYVDECLPYVEKTCFTQQKEMCKDVSEKNCTAVIDQFEERVCFNVTELLCQLAENVQYEMVDETYTVQRCTQVSDRVCDTVYDLSVSI